MLLVGFLFVQSQVVRSQDADTLYLRDGAVLRGDIVKDSMGNYVVYNKYGELTVKVDDVIYRVSEEKDEKFVQEIYIVTGKKAEIISILQREIPTHDENVQGFNLLVPGTVVGVFDADDQEVFYQSTSLGGVSKITINYGDIISEGKYLYITTRQHDLLRTDEQGRIMYTYNFTPDSEAVIKLLVKYPRDWHVDQISPQPATRYEGLVVWHLKLRRQQNFNPTITFRK
jgi:hypothetical protein